MIFNICLVIIILLVYIFTKDKKNKNNNTLFLKLIFIIFTILVASREMTRGNDTQMYLKLFERCSRLRWEAVTFDGYFEGGYLIFNVLISYISSSKRFFMIVMSIIFNCVVYCFIKKNSKNYLLSILFYVCMLFFYTSMTMMRQFMALMIVLSGFKFIKEKKPIFFVSTVILASLIHSSVWLTLFYYPLYNLKYTKKISIMVIIVSIIATINIGPIINYIYSLLGRTNYYVSRIGSDSLANTLYTIVYLFMYLFAIYEMKKNGNKGFELRENHFYLYILLFATSVNLIATNMNVLSRAAFYYEFLSIIAFPNIIETSISKINNRRLVYIIIFTFLILHSEIIMYYRPEWNSAYDYKSCIIQKYDYICE